MSRSVDSKHATGSQPWPLGTVIGVILSLVLFAVLVGMLLWFTALNRGELLTDGKTPEQKLQELQADDRMTLSSYGWVDRTKGTVRIPIDRAMSLVVAERNAEMQLPSAPVPTKDSPP